MNGTRGAGFNGRINGRRLAHIPQYGAVADPKISKSGGAEDNLSVPVPIYRKCIQRFYFNCACAIMSPRQNIYDKMSPCFGLSSHMVVLFMSYFVIVIIFVLWQQRVVCLLLRRKGNGKIHLYRAAFAHTAFSGAVVTDRAAVQPMPQHAKPAHTDFELCLNRT